MYPNIITAHKLLTQFITNKTEKHEACIFTNNIEKVVNVLKKPFTVYTEPKGALETSDSYGFYYMDPVGSNKKYLARETRFVKAIDTPFESDLINHLIGIKNPKKTKVTETCTAIEVPMKGVDGNRYLVRSHFVHYLGTKGQITIMPNGEIDTLESQHMKRNMLPGMTKTSSEFSVYEIPKNQMIQKTRGTFSSFTLINE